MSISSGAQTAIGFDDPMLEAGHSGSGAYARTRLARIPCALDPAAEPPDTEIRVNAFCPVTSMDTKMMLSAGVQPRSSVGEGLEAITQFIVPENAAVGTSTGRGRPGPTPTDGTWRRGRGTGSWPRSSRKGHLASTLGV